METETIKAIVAEFHLAADRRMTVCSLTTIVRITAHDGKRYELQRVYDVDWSKTCGCYIFHMSGAGGSQPITVSGIYVASGPVETQETPTTLVDGRDHPPWRSRETRVIRRLNHTRRLRKLPKSFDLAPGQHLLDWLQHHGIEAPSVYCSTCKDHLPDTDLCEHCWWCDKTGWYSTPSERCGCADSDECSELD